MSESRAASDASMCHGACARWSHPVRWNPEEHASGRTRARPVCCSHPPNIRDFLKRLALVRSVAVDATEAQRPGRRDAVSPRDGGSCSPARSIVCAQLQACQERARAFSIRVAPLASPLRFSVMPRIRERSAHDTTVPMGLAVSALGVLHLDTAVTLVGAGVSPACACDEVVACISLGSGRGAPALGVGGTVRGIESLAGLWTRARKALPQRAASARLSGLPRSRSQHQLNA